MIDEKFLRRVEEYSPDKVFILDCPIVEQEFLDEVKVPVVWVDHHAPLKRDKVLYFNPRKNDDKDNSSVTENCYGVVEQDLWIGMIGGVGDWQLPSFTKEFAEKYPDLFGKKVNVPEKALYETKVGELVKIFSFILKGASGHVMECIKILTRIEDPYEITNQTTPRGKYIYRRYLRVNEAYQALLEEALKTKADKNILLFTYLDNKTSFTKELSNELLYRNPRKIIILGREKSGEMKLSLRSKKHKLPALIEKALVNVKGYGGGHEHACGSCVKVEDFERFIQQFKDAIASKASE
jgi:single-stranded DNA-specific DHH superfamily exonuclease